MAQQTFGAYSAYTVGNGIRFRLNNKLIKEAEVPREAVEYLKVSLGIPLAHVPTRFEKEMATATQKIEVQAPVEAPLPLDSAGYPPLEGQTFPAAPIVSEVSAPIIPQLEENQAVIIHQHTEMTENPFLSGAPLDAAINLGRAVEAHINAQAPTTTIATDEVSSPVRPDLTAVQVPGEFTLLGASLEDLATAMFERYGIYTVFLGRHPEADEISPLSGERMSNYDRGIAYQAANRALVQGRLRGADYEQMKAERDQSWQSHLDYQKVSQTYQPPTFAQQRKENTFDYRTSVEGANQSASVSVTHPEEAEPLVQPGRPGVIRPNW